MSNVHDFWINAVEFVPPGVSYVPTENATHVRVTEKRYDDVVKFFAEINGEVVASAQIVEGPAPNYWYHRMAEYLAQMVCEGRRIIE